MLGYTSCKRHSLRLLPFLKGRGFINCTNVCLENQMWMIIASLKPANGLLTVVGILCKTINDVPHWTIFECIPEVRQLFDIIRLGLTTYRHVELLPEAIPFSTSPSKVGTLIFGSWMPLLIPCVGEYPALLLSSCSICRLWSKGVLSRADSLVNMIWSS